ncbi:MAG: hypothetical protein IT204_22615 [Fimbriimonadaceae bacterium]|nr:hypothetical protein [Fimbriimonadaceae bacterium]
MSGCLVLLLLAAAEPATPPEPTLSGLWWSQSAAGEACLEVYGQRRFVLRDGRGGTEAGDLQVKGRTLWLLNANQQRVFVFDLTAESLYLTPDLDDAPVPPGVLAEMRPHGPEQVTWHRRRGALEALPLGSAGELVGSYTLPAADQPEVLTFQPGGRFTWQGPARLRASGAYELVDGQLQLTAGEVRRRFTPRLECGPAGWALTLARTAEDQPMLVGDLADLPPCLDSTAVWRAPLRPVEPGHLIGSWECRDGEIKHRLSFDADGAVQHSTAPDAVSAYQYSLRGAVLTIGATADDGQLVGRRFLVQPQINGLLLVRLDPPPGGAHGVSSMPPTSPRLALWEAR